MSTVKGGARSEERDRMSQERKREQGRGKHPRTCGHGVGARTPNVCGEKAEGMRVWERRQVIGAANDLQQTMRLSFRCKRSKESKNTVGLVR